MAPTPDQLRCIRQTFGVPSAVVAGAGSGKTDTLTRRVVHALQHPEESGVHDINEILAITYTNKAAGELKSRIKSALEEAATEENGLGLQALKVDGAWISTIHGMCSRILKENAFSFGVDPDFEILVDEQRDALLGEAVEAALGPCADPGLQQDIQALMREYRRSDVVVMVRDLLEKAAEDPHEAQELFAVPPLTSQGDCLAALIGATQEVLVRFEAQRAESSKPLSKKACDYVDQAERALREALGLPSSADGAGAPLTGERMAWLEALEPVSALRLADRFPKLPGNLRPAKEPLESTGLFPGPTMARAALDLCLAATAGHLRALISLASAASEIFKQKKRQRGALDNGDLLALTARHLTDPKNRRAIERYHRQFVLVMVDEFQDTNQMQVDMINLVAGGADEGPSPKLCVVGDAQQSIYRFRNADLSVFKDHVAKVQAAPDGMRIELGDNFRSHGEILAFSKGVFSSVFGGDYLDLLHGRDEVRAAQGGGYHGAQSADEPFSVPRRVNVSVFGGKSATDASVAAAEAIARDFKTLVERGDRPGSMAVLLGKMTHADVYARALEVAGLKCAITGGTVFRQSPEAQLVAALLYALADMGDTEHAISVLTSDLFCLEAQDLLQLRDGGKDGRGGLAAVFKEMRLDRRGRLQMPDGFKGASPQLVCALEVLGRAALQVGGRSMASIVEDVLVDSGWLERLGSQGQACAANAFKAMRLVRQIEADAATGPLTLARSFEARLSVAKEAPGVLSAKGDDFVRIMTIHASKGLSIPIAAVAEADFSFRERSKLRSLTLGRTTYLALMPQASLDPLASSGLVRSSAKDYGEKGGVFDSTAQAQALLQASSGRKAPNAADYFTALGYLNLQGDLEEHQRKLYVAFTRSKEALFVALRKAGKSPKRRQGGEFDVVQAVAQLVLGDPDAPAFADPKEGICQLVPLSTAYPAAPLHDIDWQLRFQVVPAGDQSQEETDDPALDKGAPWAEKAPSREFLVPVAPAAPAAKAFSYRPAWSQGVLSASMLKKGGAAADGNLQTVAVSGEDAGEMTVSLAPDDQEAAAPAKRGSAFHVLGQWAAAHWRPGGPMPLPPDQRIEATARQYGLSDRQRDELPLLLERWLASDQAAFAAAHKVLLAEQPFWVPLQPSDPVTGTNPLVLQGFIDLLAYDQFGQGAAYVVDYKTGIRLTTEDDRRRAYGIQAACYAYALLLQGFESVVLDFVFVDQLTEGKRGPVPSVTQFPAPGQSPFTTESARSAILRSL